VDQSGDMYLFTTSDSIWSPLNSSIAKGTQFHL
jgi:hypothetical protein